ncbi:Lrp/AsnC family transcriptional regulator [Pseudonocardia sp. GCM10023141]|uniref:Lrp/AsnC family transcriptional regulator n=1 Tax=Pseudonocardia sp. GCM10023141 TaxID=3252653 RepID=UPI00360F9C68
MPRPLTDETDLALIAAIRLDPRAPWAKIGQALDVDAATAARRWARLVDDGTAWLTADPGTPRADHMCLAFVEVNCATDQAAAAGRELAGNPRIASVEHVTGGHDLCLTVFAPGLDGISDVLLAEIAQVPGVIATRSYLATQFFTADRTGQRGTLDEARLRRPPTAPPLPEPDVRELLHAMAGDCRISVSALAQRLGVSRATARRHMDTALAHRQLVIRCDVTRSVTGTPVVANIRTIVPPDELAAVGRAVAALPGTRLSAELAGGPSNLLLCFWLPGLTELERVEVTLAERFPVVHVADRVVILRTIKRFGRMLDARGRATAQIVLDPWDTGDSAGSYRRLVAPTLSAI